VVVVAAATPPYISHARAKGRWTGTSVSTSPGWHEEKIVGPQAREGKTTALPLVGGRV